MEFPVGSKENLLLVPATAQAQGVLYRGTDEEETGRKGSEMTFLDEMKKKADIVAKAEGKTYFVVERRDDGILGIHSAQFVAERNLRDTCIVLYETGCR